MKAPELVLPAVIVEEMCVTGTQSEDVYERKMETQRQ